MKDVVTGECGTKVSASTPDELTDNFSSALSAYHGNPDLVRRHGEAGQARVRKQYTWPKCGDLLDEVYVRVANR